MICPVCGNPMEEGKLHSSRSLPVLWVPANNKRRAWTLWQAEKLGFKFLALPFFSVEFGYVKDGSQVETWLCPKCNTGLIPGDWANK